METTNIMRQKVNRKRFTPEEIHQMFNMDYGYIMKTKEDFPDNWDVILISGAVNNVDGYALVKKELEIKLASEQQRIKDLAKMIYNTNELTDEMIENCTKVFSAQNQIVRDVKSARLDMQDTISIIVTMLKTYFSEMILTLAKNNPLHLTLLEVLTQRYGLEVGVYVLGEHLELFSYPTLFKEKLLAVMMSERDITMYFGLGLSGDELRNVIEEEYTMIDSTLNPLYYGTLHYLQLPINDVPRSRYTE